MGHPFSRQPNRKTISTTKTVRDFNAEEVHLQDQPPQLKAPARAKPQSYYKSWMLYDTGTLLTAGLTELEYFKLPIGQGTSATRGTGSKTAADTNMKIASLPADELLLIYRIGVYYDPRVSVANAATISAGVVEISFDNNAVVFQQPVWACPAGGGIAGSVATTATSTTILALNNGLQTQESRNYLEYLVEIGPKQNFTVKINWGAATGTVTAVAGPIGAGGTIGIPITIALYGIMQKRIV